MKSLLKTSLRQAWGVLRLKAKFLLIFVFLIIYSIFVSALEADETPDGHTISCDNRYFFCYVADGVAVDFGDNWSSNDESRYTEGEGHIIAAGSSAVNDGIITDSAIFDNANNNWTLIYKLSKTDQNFDSWFDEAANFKSAPYSGFLDLQGTTVWALGTAYSGTYVSGENITIVATKYASTNLNYSLYYGNSIIPNETGTFSDADFGTTDFKLVAVPYNSGTGWIEYLAVWNGTIAHAPYLTPLAPDTSAPLLLDVTLLSTVEGREDRNVSITATPTFYINATDVGTVKKVRCGNDSTLTFDTAVDSRNGTFVSGNNWTCTLASSDQLTVYGVPQPIYWWALDDSGNNHSVYNLTNNVTLVRPPTYSNFANNASIVTKINGVVNSSIDFADDMDLVGYKFAHNNTGTLTNGTFTPAVGLTNYADELVTIIKGRGNYICFQYWINNTNKLANQTRLDESGACFTVANTLPETPSISYPIDGKNYSDIPYINYSGTDVDSDRVKHQDHPSFNKLPDLHKWNIKHDYRWC